MRMIKKIIRISLKSDLLCSNGLGDANIIDIDVSLLKNGLPYIPGKRIKGILRDAYEEGKDFDYFEKDSKEIFGDAGGNESKIVIGNAYIKDCDEVSKYLSAHHEINSSIVTDAYTYLRTRTSIDENGVALDKSLRTMRVVNKYNEFYCEVYVDESVADDLVKICECVKRMGMSRNRGLGNVEFTCEEDSSVSSAEDPIDSIDRLKDDEYEINLTLYNDEDIVVSDFFGSGQDYIPGSSLLGYFAKQYFNEQNKDKYEEDRFNEYFLEGNIIFNNFYISNSKGDMAYPLPASLRRDKMDKSKIYNSIKEIPSVPTKSMIGYYGCIDKQNSKICINEVSMCSNYHIQTKDGHVADGGLYEFSVIEKGQYFSGSIICKGKYLSFIVDTLNNSNCFKIGRSKTAQYGKVSRVNRISPTPYKTEIIKSNAFVIYFKSDAIFIDENGNNTIDINVINNIIASKLGIKPDKFTNYFNTNTIGGYNNKWLMQRKSYNAISKGSQLVVELNETIELKKSYRIGELQNEGYGNIIVENLDNNISYSISTFNIEDNKVRELPVSAKKIRIYYIKQKINSLINNYAMELKENEMITHGIPVIPCVRLILKDAKTFDQFKKSVNSIKESSNSRAEKKKLINELFVNKANSVDDLFSSMKSEFEELCKLENKSEDDYKNYYKMVYINARLAALKYKN